MGIAQILKYNWEFVEGIVNLHQLIIFNFEIFRLI